MVPFGPSGASKSSLKGFCSAAPSSGTVLFPTNTGGCGVEGMHRKRGKGRQRKGGERVGWGTQITSHHCYSPARGQQQREACCPISCTVLSLSKGQRVRSISHPHKRERTHKHHKTQTETQAQDAATPPKTHSKTKNNTEGAKGNIKVVWSSWGSSKVPFPSCLFSSLSYTHTASSLSPSHRHTHTPAELVHLPCSASSAAAERRNE